MHLVSYASGARHWCNELCRREETLRYQDDDTKRQLMHTLAHAIVFIVSICCL